MLLLYGCTNCKLNTALKNHCYVIIQQANKQSNVTGQASENGDLRKATFVKCFVYDLQQEAP